MQLTRWVDPPASALFSRKLAARVEFPRNAGVFHVEDAERLEMRLVRCSAGSVETGVRVVFYWLVDESDGIVADAKFQVFGPPELIAAADAACDLVLHKSYAQAQRLTAELIDKHLADKGGTSAFSKQSAFLLNLVLEAIEQGYELCTDIPYEDVYVSPPVGSGVEDRCEYPGWDSLGVREQMAVIEDVIAEEIRPYVELDAGGVEVSNIVKSREVIIVYQGACTSCYSATGATLHAIEQILQSKVHPEIRVIPLLPTSTPPSL